MARLLSIDPNNPELGIYEDDQGQTFTAPVKMLPGLDEEKGPAPGGFADEASQILNTPVPAEEQAQYAWVPEESGFEARPAPAPVQTATDAVPAPAAPAPQAAMPLPDLNAPGASLPRPELHETGVFGNINDTQVARGARAGYGFAPGGQLVPVPEPTPLFPSARGGAAPQMGATFEQQVAPGEALAGFEQAGDQVIAGNEALVPGVVEDAREVAGILDQSDREEAVELAQMQQLEQERQQRAQGMMEDLHGYLQQMANQRIDPNRFFADRGAASSFGAAVSVAAGAIAQALLPGTQNAAMSIIEGAVERDVQAQMANMQNAQATMSGGMQLLNALEEHYGDAQTALAAFRTIRLQQVQNQIQTIAARATGRDARARLQVLTGEIEMQQQQWLAEVQRGALRVTGQGPRQVAGIAGQAASLTSRSERPGALTPQVAGARQDPAQQAVDQTLQARGTDPQAARAGGRPRGVPAGRTPAQARPQAAQQQAQSSGSPGVDMLLRLRMQTNQFGEGYIPGGVAALGGTPQEQRAAIDRINAALLDDPRTAHLVAGYNSDTGRAWVSRLDNTVAREEVDRVDDRRTVVTQSPTDPATSVRPLEGQEDRFNEALRTAEGRTIMRAAVALPEFSRQVRRLEELQTSWSSRAPTSAERAELAQIKLNLARPWADIDGTMAMQDADRAFYLNDRIAGMGDWFVHDAAQRAATMSALRSAEAAVQAQVASIGGELVSPSVVGRRLERDNPGDDHSGPQTTTVLEDIGTGVSDFVNSLIPGR